MADEEIKADLGKVASDLAGVSGPVEPKFIEIGDLPEVERLLRSGIGGQPWLEWRQDVGIRMAVSKYVLDMGLDPVLDEIRNTVDLSWGPENMMERSGFWRRVLHNIETSHVRRKGYEKD